MRGLFLRFFRSESTGSRLLLLAIASSLILANSSLGPYLEQALSAQIIGEMSILAWINDGLMSLFFLLVGLEVKRAFLSGELSSPQRAALPLIAALGGCLLPAGIFLLLNCDLATARGWAIPMATDIAFALALLQLALGRRAGPARVFLSTLAIADDLFAIIVIALFYSHGLDGAYLLASAGIVLLQVLLNRFGVLRLRYYLLSGIALWYCIHHSGIHATVAGVLTAFTIPLRTMSAASPLERLEHRLLKPVNLFIMPLFALANTNIPVTAAAISGLKAPLAWGISAGLLLGKPLGILLSSVLALRLRIGSLPPDLDWKRITGLGILAGIGFTMSIFVTMLAFDDPQQQLTAKLAILLSSVVAGLAGLLVLRRA